MAAQANGGEGEWCRAIIALICFSFACLHSLQSQPPPPATVVSELLGTTSCNLTAGPTPTLTEMNDSFS